MNTFLELLLFINSLFTEVATNFLRPNSNNNVFVYRSDHFMKCFKKMLGIPKIPFHS